MKENLEKILKQGLENIEKAKTVEEVQEETMVISLDSEWGTGKTIFINQFIYLLKNSDSYNELGIDEDIKEKKLMPIKRLVIQ